MKRMCAMLAATLLCGTGAATGQPAEQQAGAAAPATSPPAPRARAPKRYLSQPLVSEIFTADPSAHVWNDRIYVYPSHDIDGPATSNEDGAKFEMRDYRVLSMDRIGGPVTIHPVALDLRDVPWASQQLWAPDAAYKNGTYYLYFPAKDKAGVFRIGVATSTSPVGPFAALPRPIKGSFSIDPAVFTDDDGASYMYFGGIHGGQLQRHLGGSYDPNGSNSDAKAPDQPAIPPKIARMAAGMTEFAEAPRDVLIVDAAGKPILGGDHDRRFFEGAWMHKYGGKYYLSYSTGTSHYIAYATGTSPYGPFTYQGRILQPVSGWTTHHSIVAWGGRWWLFYADAQLSGQTHLRNVKVTELFYNPDGTIRTINPFVE